VTVDARAIAFVAAVGVALGAIPLYVGGSMLYERVAYGSAGSPASGEVVGTERLWLRELASPIRKRKLWRLAYEFRTGKGDLVRASGIYMQSTTMADPAPGLKVRVLYLPEDPASSYVEDAHKAWDALWFLGIGVFVWFVIGAFVWWEIKQARNKAR
jgi:hypothetical protein